MSCFHCGHDPDTESRFIPGYGVRTLCVECAAGIPDDEEVDTDRGSDLNDEAAGDDDADRIGNTPF